MENDKVVHSGLLLLPLTGKLLLKVNSPLINLFTDSNCVFLLEILAATLLLAVQVEQIWY